MTRSEIELIDGSKYGIVRKDRISSNQIKTRPASFNAISKVWNDFCLQFYTNKLNSEKEAALTQNYAVDNNSNLTPNAIEQINNKSLIIARLEEKIKILSKQNVPTNYVDNRAIKLRNKMMNNLVINCNNAYSIGTDKMDAVFGQEVNSELDKFSTEIPVPDNNTENTIEENAEIASSVGDNVEVDNIVTPEVPVVEDASSTEEGIVVDDSSIVESPVIADTVDSTEEDNVAVNLETSSDDTINDSGDNIEFSEPVISSINTDTKDNVVVDVNDESNIVSDDVAVSNDSISTNTDGINNSDYTLPVSFNDYSVESQDTNVESAGEISSSEIDQYDSNDLSFDNDETALFELINPYNEEKSDVASQDTTDVSVVESDDSNLYDNITVSKNGSSPAKIDRYKESKSDIMSNLLQNGFKVITFKDIFKPTSYASTNVVANNDVSNSDRYVPLIVPERNDSMERSIDMSNDNENEVTVSSVQDMKNQYLKLQQLLKSKTARLNSVKAQREAIISEVESTNKIKNDVTASLNEKYQLMAKYIDELQKKCEIVDDETASNENDINSSKQIIEENRQVASSTQRAIEELEDILRYSNSNEESYEYESMRRVA